MSNIVLYVSGILSFTQFLAEENFLKDVKRKRRSNCKKTSVQIANSKTRTADEDTYKHIDSSNEHITSNKFIPHSINSTSHSISF
jgi:hypothetical protein